MKQKIFRLVGQIQYYAWGGYEFIPRLLGFDNAQHKPCAEYWMGVHPAAPGSVETDEGLRPLLSLIVENSEAFLGQKVLKQFGALPYLLKVLDVREMLSIQVHPSKEAALKGFATEDVLGIAIDAKQRNYKDRNHKPEVMIALGDFWLLHGFKKEDELIEILINVAAFNGLLEIFNSSGYSGLYRYIMELPQSDADSILLPLLQFETTRTHTKSDPGYWVNKLYNGNIPTKGIDRGIFSIYFFNIVHLTEGEGIFQSAGVPHAYLEGQNIELMANSDNVLRGGLTPKHIDVPELLNNMVFEGIVPHILVGEECINGEHLYSMAVEDFGICAIKLDNGREYINESTSPEIFLVLEGEVFCNDLNSKKGETFIVSCSAEYTIRAVEKSILYKAYVP